MQLRLVRKEELTKIDTMSTFHVSLPFENDEGVAPAASILITNDPYTFNRPETFEFTPEIVLSRIFWLEYPSTQNYTGKGCGKPDEQ